MAEKINRDQLIKQLKDSLGGEANLTDQELQSRLGQYQQLAGLPQQQTGPDYQRLGNDIFNRFNQLASGYIERPGTQISGVEKAADWASRWFLDPGAKDPNNFADTFAQIVLDTGGNPARPDQNPGLINDRLKKAARDVWNEVHPQTTLSSYQTTSDVPGSTMSDQYNPDIKRIQDMLGTRGKLAASDTAAQASIASLPAELAQGTNAYIANQTDQAGQFLEQQLAPQIAQSENMRGMLYSGDLASELSRGAASVYGGVENQQATLQAQDRDFYTNAAYNYQLAKSLNAGQDLTLQTAQDRSSALAQQGYNFQAGQADTQRQLQEKLLNQSQQSGLIAQNAAIRRQEDAQRRASRAGMASGIGSSVGAIGGALIGNALLPGVGGIVAGSAIGSATGSTGGGLFGGGR